MKNMIPTNSSLIVVVIFVTMDMQALYISRDND